MHIPSWLETVYFKCCDVISAWIPQTKPEANKLKRCKIIAHRGIHDNESIIENTLAAFDAAMNEQLWGIELDVRWTKDLVPIVFHDATCQRIFNNPVAINTLTLEQICQQFPLIPTLEEVILHYGKKLHLMVEIKKEYYPDPEKQNTILKALLTPLSPMEDYHLISIHPDMFEYFDFVPSQTFLPIAQLNAKQLLKLTLEKNYGGVTGHYYLVSNTIANICHQHQLHIGTGHIGSLNCLYREIHRGTEWLFTDDAVKLKRYTLSVNCESKK